MGQTLIALLGRRTGRGCGERSTGQTLIALLGRRTGRGCGERSTGQTLIALLGRRTGRGMWREINGTNPDCPPWPPHREGDLERDQRDKP